MFGSYELYWENGNPGEYISWDKGIGFYFAYYHSSQDEKEEILNQKQNKDNY